MKGLVWYSLLLSRLFVAVTAYGRRGAAERIALYFAYLAEGILNTDDADDKVGAGCPGSLANHRCTFDEFLEFLWEPQKGKTLTRPTPNIMRPGQVFTNLDYGTLFEAVTGWVDRTTGAVLTGATNSQKIYLGSANWFDAMSKVGGPVGDLRDAIPGMPAGPARDAAQAVVDGGTKAFQAACDFRLKDMEEPGGNNRRGRIYAVATNLGLAVEDIEVKPGPETYGAVQEYKTIDADATIAKWTEPWANAHNGESFEAAFLAAVSKWETGSKVAREHWAAMTSLYKSRDLAGRC